MGRRSLRLDFDEVTHIHESVIHPALRGGIGCEKPKPDPPAAIFASNDDMAAATVAVAHRCGFDDTALATTIWPELTTIHQPTTEMARLAVEMLVREIRARRSGRADDLGDRHVLVDFTLIQRQSEGVPKSA